VKLQKKQIKYEDLKKKLEELQKNVNKSQTELDKFKNDKDAQVDKYLESIISQSEQFDWD
jgi:predicted nuclease with TOPRIM domain